MTKIYEVYVTKRFGLDSEAQGIVKNLNENLGFNLSNVRVFNRYLVKGLSKEEFENSLFKVFAEKNADEAYLSFDELQIKGSYLITQLLPGQFDMRANAAMECLNLVTSNFENEVKHQRLIDFGCQLSSEDLSKISTYLINKVEMKEGSISDFDNLFLDSNKNKDLPKTYEGFMNLNEEGIISLHKELSLAMTVNDLKVVVEYFKSKKRNPNETEIKLLDTYWSDHCRHTTFNTELTDINIEDEEVKNAYEKYLSLRKEIGRTKPVTLMDLGTFGARYLKTKGLVNDLDESDEINACSIRRNLRKENGTEEYLIQFKNETHNHPTEIEPFGGAATCLGGAIRDPLSGRAFVYQAMRVTGASNPLEGIGETLVGKLPQKNIVTTAAKGYSSYGNQIGLAAGVVHEIYHPGYKAKRMEVGAVIGSTPYDKVMRIKPVEGDVIILVGGRTGRDGVGGATGSSKSHDTKSIETSGAEVQKGNAPIERKIQRLMRNEEVKVLIKKCNDFGAGGVAVAVGELADGLEINLDKVKLKYEGLSATETAVSESQERMAVVIDKNDVQKFIKYLDEENLEYAQIAKVTSNNRLIMKWNNEIIVDLDRDFLDSAGAKQYQEINATKDEEINLAYKKIDEKSINEMITDLNNASQRALNEMFDSSNGASTKVLPFGGKYQDTESSYMACHIPLTYGISKDVSVMSYGYDPYISSTNQYKGAYLAVVESLAKMAVSGANLKDVRLSFQEYFEKLSNNPSKWGKPFKSILGALMAQLDYEVPAIGGKDSMSGTFNDLNVPPTLISFACNVMPGEEVIVNTLKGESDLYLLKTEYKNGLPIKESFKSNVELLHKLNKSGNLIAADVVSQELLMTILKMAFGNRTSFNVEIDEKLNVKDVASFVVAVKKGTKVEAIKLGSTSNDLNAKAYINGIEVNLHKLARTNKDVLGKVFNENVKEGNKVTNISYNKRPNIIIPKLDVKPRVVIPVFPGSNCEYDLERAFKEAGADVKIFILKNRDKNDLIESSKEFMEEIKKSQIMMLPGGFSAGDEPDGSGKFIGNVFRNELIANATSNLIDNRNGLVLGICNGFQALIKLGLVPYGKIIEPTKDMPTLTNNVVGKHIDMISRVRIASTNSPWLSHVNVGEVYSVPISHGEGRFIANDEVMKELIENGQIITQYCDLDGDATMEAPFNPNGSYNAVEGIISKDGRVLGKMGHNERWTNGLFKNYDDNFDMKLFRSGVEYFTK